MIFRKRSGKSLKPHRSLPDDQKDRGGNSAEAQGHAPEQTRGVH